jgi:hypothetical protein
MLIFKGVKLYKKFCWWRTWLTGKQANLEVINEAENQVNEQRLSQYWRVSPLIVVAAIGISSALIWKRTHT